ncbi:MAG: isochorismatase [Bacteroidetes bacterium]|nr:isochorismatase [Rhodothermia bacterium]MCS7154962.1 isochorismatase [Bacteroidota bacterium]MCX7907246.1 isochorismatase [Bacteroidota bacterium]MDW8138028.1 isochorismatase [Bacteroidota bacterium]MDW8286120.1 isochorismatase [Bacteroidota bacterium]
MRALPLPPHFDPERVGALWKVDYEALAQAARQWARAYGIRPAVEDRFRVALLLVDVQNTFCLPDFELFVRGPSGMGAVEDNRRLVAFLYRCLPCVTQVVLTLDTHQAAQIFHSLFWVDAEGRHPDPYTQVTAEEVRSGRWRPNAALAPVLGVEEERLARHARYYTEALERAGKYVLTIWPYHAMLGGVGHALVPAVEEAVFFHAVARYSQPDFRIKGRHPLTEHYSAFGPEVHTGADGEPLGAVDQELIDRLLSFDAILVAGQAKSHCVAWTVEDLLARLPDPALAQRVYLLEDCASPVVVPGAIDYTEAAEAAYRRFAEAGAHLVRSTTPMEDWPGPIKELFA